MWRLCGAGERGLQGNGELWGASACETGMQARVGSALSRWAGAHRCAQSGGAAVARGWSERGLESDGAQRGVSGRAAVMRARGIIGPMRDALGGDAEGVMAGGVMAETCAA